ncbi:MAG: tetratricopeptide repeat protein [Nitrososphaera sp.]
MSVEQIQMECVKIHEVIKQKNFPLAESMACALIEQTPDSPDAIFVLGSVYQVTGRFGLALQFYNRVLGMAPASVPVLNNIGGCYHQCHDDEKSFKYYTTAYNLSGGKDVDVLSNLAGLSVNTNHPAIGLQYSDKVMEIKPDHPNSLWNRSLLELALEDWENGFKHYEAGIVTGDRKLKDYNLPLWDGEEIESVVVCGEQGIGDELMFSSILEDLFTRVKRIILDCHPRLASIFEGHRAKIDNPDNLIIVPNRKVKETEYIRLYDVKAHMNIGSLGQFFRKKDSDFPRTTYLLPNSNYVNYFKKRFNSNKLCVGVSWFGGASSTRADLRSIPLEYMIPFLNMENIHFVNLQYNVSKKDLDLFYNKTGIRLYHYCTEDDFYAWAMLACSVDLVVTVCNSMAHLCGAFGLPCICLTPMQPAWRYGLVKDKMTWYDSVKLIRQKENDEWSHVIVELMQEVKKYVY